MSVTCLRWSRGLVSAVGSQSLSLNRQKNPRCWQEPLLFAQLRCFQTLEFMRRFRGKRGGMERWRDAASVGLSGSIPRAWVRKFHTTLSGLPVDGSRAFLAHREGFGSKMMQTASAPRITSKWKVGRAVQVSLQEEQSLDRGGR